MIGSLGTRLVAVRDRQLSVADHGLRAPLVLVHGFPLDHAVWRPQFDAFVASRRVVAPDLAGFGQSAVPPHASIEEHADDLVALLDELGIRRAIVVGLSMGGYVALSMVRRHPKRLAGLVLACSRAGADSESGRAGRYQMVRSVEQQGVGVVGDALLPRLFGPEAETELVEQVRAMMHRQPADGVIAALKAMAARPSSIPYLSEIGVPTLVVTGAHDQVIPVHESKRLADAIPGASLAVVPGSGHLVNVEAPGAFNAAVRSFLDTADES